MIADSEQPPGHEGLTDSQLWRVDQICDGFETAWKSARRPQIEAFLDASRGPDRELLLRELVLLDVHYRRRQGESPGITDYQHRFPEVAETWLDAELAPGPRDDTAAGRAGGQRAAELQENPAASSFPLEVGAPRTFGKFQLLERVGVGGFGTVWRALDVRLNRIVALKIPHPHLIETAEDVARFYREARAAAQLRHPGIVTVHEVTDFNGLLILVCDFVTGTSLRDLLLTRRLSPQAAAKLVAKVADALAYAHSMGAIHRDIKPANIMLDTAFLESGAVHDDEASGWPGEPRIVDFGLAFLDQESIHLTHDGAIVGTPAYMSPEQAVGRDSAHPIDHRCDIYSLGVVLYETLTGTLPFAGTRSELLKKVISSDPPSPRRFDRAIPRDLESICLKTMAKEPRHRYASARELADDCKRYLDGEPIRARPVRLWEWAWRYARRRPLAAAFAAMVAVTALAVVGLVVGWRFHIQLRHEYVRTEKARSAEAQEHQRAEAYLYYNRMALAEREYSANNVERVERLLEDCPPGLRGWEWSYLKRQCHHEILTIRHAPERPQSVTVTRVAFSPDGLHLATACKDGMIRLWNASSGELVRVFGGHDQAALGLAYHPSGSQIASSGQDSQIKVWDAATGALLRTLRGHEGAVYCVAYSSDGRRLASGDGYPPWESAQHLRSRGIVKVWDESTGNECFSLRGHTQNVMGVAFSPDGRRLATVSGGSLAIPQVASNKSGELLIWDAGNGELVRTIRGHEGPLTAVAYSPDGETLATSSWDRTVKLWDPETGVRRSTLAGHCDWVSHLAFDSSGLRLATAGADGAVQLWDVATGRSLLTFRGHTQNVTCVAFDPNGQRLASASSDQTVKVWDTSASREAFIWRGRGPVVRLAFFPDSRRLVLGGNFEESSGRMRPTLTILEPTTRRTVELVTADSRRDDCINGVAVSSDGTLVAASFSDQKTEVRKAATGALVHAFAVAGCEVQSAVFSPDNAALAVVGLVPIPSRGERFETYRSGGYLAVWDLATGRARWARVCETGKIRSVDFSPDNRLVATADNDGGVTLWDTASGEPIHRLLGHRRLVSWIAFSPDGGRLASASWDQTAKVWDIATRQAVVTLRGHMRSVLCVAFSPDGTRLATGSEDQTIKLWDAATGEEVLTLRGHAGVVSSVAFSPDGGRLASAGTDGSVQVREAGPPSLFSVATSPSN
jgi:WD40 repeat protein/tRNA A-37 threonylcarbamoyl transferase component Bud32